jgi:protein ImuB
LVGLWRVDGEVVIRPLELSAATQIKYLPTVRGKAGRYRRRFRDRTSACAPVGRSRVMEQGDIEVAAETHGTSLSACIDRLSVRLARSQPGANSHIPERWRWQPR